MQLQVTLHLHKKQQQTQTSVPEASNEYTHITQEDRAVTSKGWYREQEVDLYDVNVTRALLSYRDDRATQHYCSD